MDPFMLLLLQNQQQSKNDKKFDRQNPKNFAATVYHTKIDEDGRPAVNSVITKAGATTGTTAENRYSLQKNTGALQSRSKVSSEPLLLKSSCRDDSLKPPDGMNPQIQYYIDVDKESTTQMTSPLSDFGVRNGIGAKRPATVNGRAAKSRGVEVPVVSWISNSTLSQTTIKRVDQQSAPQQINGLQQQQQHTGVSPVPSLTCSDIGEMDLDFWEVDPKVDSNGNSQMNSQNQQISIQQLAQSQQIYAPSKDNLSPTTSQSSYQSSGGYFGSSGDMSMQGLPPQIPQNSPQNISPPHNGQMQPTPPDANNNNSNPGSTGSNDYAKPKKATLPRQQEELCLVCGDRASGYHYNALTCEGCKGFFRRSITKNSVYTCKYGDNCDIDMYMRRKCQQCRLRKCLRVGMRPECVVPESQNVMKRHNKKKSDPQSANPHVIEIRDEKPNVAALSRAIRQIQPLTPDQESLINKLVYYQQEFESPTAEDITKITAFPLGNSDEDNQKRFQHITEITILTVQLIVEFSKRVPGFDTLQREDQITLLKACSSEVMMLRGARKYDIKTDSIVFANNQPYTRDNYRSASVGDSADALFHFCRNMCHLRVDNAEYALLTAIVIFSERPSLLEPEKVDQIQMFYVDTLRMYSENHRHQPESPAHFAKLLSILTELRTLGNMNSEMCFSLKVKQNKKLPPFLAEIWDIQG